jgi:putative tryptophan/tyrosine transport system substrate-binding protein
MTKKAIAVLLVILALAYLAEAQQTGKVPRIGYVSTTGVPNAPGRQVEAFRQGLRDLGYIESKNILVEYRYIEGMINRAPDLVAEVLNLKIDVLVATALTPVRAAKEATKTIPIVMVTTQDPLKTGLIDSFARPGGNVTGLARLTRELGGKRLGIAQGGSPKAISRRSPIERGRAGHGYRFERI